MATEVSETIQNYAAKISGSWSKAAQSILDAGRYLLEAEDNLRPDEYRRLKIYLVEEVRMSATVISKLRKIASNPILTAVENIPKLPPSYATMYRMSQAEDKKLSQAFSDGIITPETQIKDVEKELFSKEQKQANDDKSKPRITVTFTGNIDQISKEKLERLSSILDQLESEANIIVRRPK